MPDPAESQAAGARASDSRARDRNAGDPQPVRDGLRFLGVFFRRPGATGAILPSSRYLARALVGALDLRPGDLVVEFGPGTGPMTQVIHSRLPEGVRYLGIEREARFVELLRRRFPGFDFHHGSAGDLGEILTARGLPRPRRIVSGIPFASLPEPVQTAIADGVAANLAADGEFRTFQYVHAYPLPAARRFRAAMRARFAGFGRLGPVLRNVPPAFVLRYWDAVAGRPGQHP